MTAHKVLTLKIAHKLPVATEKLSLLNDWRLIIDNENVDLGVFF